MLCPHKRIRTIELVLHPSDPSQYLHRICLTASCEDCKVEFRFATMALSEDRTELSAWITEKVPGMVQ